MPKFDAKQAVAAPWGKPFEITYSEKDVLLYNVGVGAKDLRFVYEGHDQFAVFPTFPIRFGGLGAVTHGFVPVVGPLNIDAERFLEVIRPLPPNGATLSVQSRVVGLHSKGSNALVEYETKISDEHGADLVRMVNGSMLRGVDALGDIEPFEGAGVTYAEKINVPNRSPDVVLDRFIPENAAHIYRLSGDMNPLHVDPNAAAFGGFDRVILHGLCTFGNVASTLLGGLCDDDASRFRRIKVRFASPVFPGERLAIDVWHERPGRAIFQVRAVERENTLVVTNAYFEFSEASAKL